MQVNPVRSGRRRRLLACTVAGASLLPMAAAQVSAPAAATTGYTTNCPRPESLVPKAAWHRHTLTKGVVLSEGTARDARGYVSMHVLSVDMTQRGISLRPLVRHLAERSPLSSLAAGHPKLVAATN